MTGQDDTSPDMPADDTATDGLSAVYARSEGLRPKVEQPSSPWTMVLGLGGVAVLGLFAFSTLSSGRMAHAQTAPIRIASIDLKG